jgi:hypothetical protein
MLRSGNETLRATMTSDWSWRFKPVYVGWMFELWIARAEGEIAWCEGVADMIASGVSYLPPNVEHTKHSDRESERPGGGEAADE